MERTSQEVNYHDRRGGHRRPRFLPSWIILSCLLLFPWITRAQSADLLVIENTQHLVVYNAFQQIQQKPNAIRSLEPIVILHAYQLLSDGVTACMKVEAGGEVYYLLLEKKGRIANLRKLGFTKTFLSKRILSDTVEILSARRMVLRDVISKRNIDLKTGDRCVRYFADRKLVYAKIIGALPRYGWIEFPPAREGSWWRVLKIRGSVAPLPLQTRQRITGTVDEINNKLTQLYKMFAAETETTLAPPQFQIRQVDSLLTVSLLPADAVTHYRQSLNALHSRVQVALLGTGYEAVLKGNTIEVHRR